MQAATGGFKQRARLVASVLMGPSHVRAREPEAPKIYTNQIGRDLMVWIWNDPDEDKLPICAEYNHSLSTFNPSETLDGRRLQPPDSGNAILRVKRFGSRKVRSLHCLPTTGSAPVIGEELRKIIARLADPDEVQFYPVSADTVDGRVEGYSFVIPLNRITCTDLQKSVITAWTVPNKYAYGYRSLRLLSNCLNDLAIARDDVTNVIVVSDALRDALVETNDKGLAFTWPEETRSLF